MEVHSIRKHLSSPEFKFKGKGSLESDSSFPEDAGSLHTQNFRMFLWALSKFWHDG